jgi:putative tryptophan/tyrosine transport system substrate-binding protein
MRRREFISLVGAATVVRPLAARAQQAMPVIGFLGSTSPDYSLHLVAAFRQGLKGAGFIEGQNTLIEYRWAEGHYDRLLALATDLVRHEVTVIVTLGGAPAAQAAKSATLTIPIVFVTGGDPVQLGLVASLNRPGGNLTGVSALSNTLAAKQLELLHELMPAAPLVAFLVNPNNPLTEPDAKDLRAAAHSVGQQILLLNAGAESDIGKAFTLLVQQHAGALIVQADPLFNNQPERLAALAAGHAVPTI